jgi:hypothetical protein
MEEFIIIIMELKKDFVETICRLYVEKHKPQVFRKILESLVKEYTR